MNSASTQGKNLSHDVKLFTIAIIVCIVVKLFLPASGGLTQKGVSFVAVFISTIVMWIAVEDKSWPSLLSIVGMVTVAGATAKDVFVAAFTNDVVLITFASLILAATLNKTGATEYIAKWFLSRATPHRKTVCGSGAGYGKISIWINR